MATIQFTYKVTVSIKDEEINKLTEFLEKIRELGGTAELQKTTTVKD